MAECPEGNWSPYSPIMLGIDEAWDYRESGETKIERVQQGVFASQLQLI